MMVLLFGGRSSLPAAKKERENTSFSRKQVSCCLLVAGLFQNTLPNKKNMSSSSSSCTRIGFYWTCFLFLLCETNAWTTPRTVPPSTVMWSSLGSTLESKEQYDIVKVDLDNDRDYPIYIGTGYSDEECK